MIIEYSTEAEEYVKELFRKNRFRPRGHTDGTNEQKFIGYLGQVIVCDELKLPRPKIGKSDCGADIVYNGKTWDIKTNLSNYDYHINYVLPVLACQIDYPCYGYVFLSYYKTKKRFTFCGLITKKRFLEVATFYPEGYKILEPWGPFVFPKDTYRITGRDLYGYQ